MVASRNRSGPYHRARVVPDQPATDAQCATWANMTDVSALWNLIAQERRHAWEILARGVHSRPKLGMSGSLSGCQLFKKLNRVLATCGRQPLLDPPPLPQFSPNPVNGFEIRQVHGGIVLLLKLSRKLRWQARPALEDILVEGWAPCNAGAEVNTLYSFVGVLPPPVHHQSDFTELYMEKLLAWRNLPARRYQVPLEGSRIFIRVVQQVNGWRNELDAYRANVLVPVNEESRARELAALLKRWPSDRPHQ